MNKVFLRGNVGHSPKITDFENGGKVAQFSLATTERGYTTKDGKEIEERTEWHNILVRKTGLAKVCEQYVKKGTPLLIVGRIQSRDYKDKEGNEKRIIEIIAEEMELLGSKDKEEIPAPTDIDDLPDKW